MAKAELIEYIKREELQGYTPLQLHNYLVRLGYPAALVEEAIREANATHAYTAAPEHWRAYYAARGATSPETQRTQQRGSQQAGPQQAHSRQTQEGRPSNQTLSNQPQSNQSVLQRVDATGGESVGRRFFQKPPTSVLVLAALHAFAGLAFVVFGGLLRWSIIDLPGFLSLFRFVVAVFAMVLIVLGVCMLVIAWGLWALKPWAHTLALMFSVLSFFTVAGAPLSVIVLFVLTREEVKRAFTPSRTQ